MASDRGPGAPGGDAPGWYGKLSTLGDFASRRLAPAAQQVLDRWLSEAIAGSQQQLGDAWLQRYLDSPLQRFVLGPGLVDASWWFGVLMPSCDNVGRYFPLVVLQPRALPPSERFGLDHLELWWARAGEAALETLADTVDVERFDRALAELPPWPAVRPLPDWAAALAGPAGAGALPGNCTPADLAGGLAAAGWLQRLHGQSLWWSWRPGAGGPAAGNSTCRIVPGLPTPALFAAMLAPPP
jgi:type VI secretion system protein ImpM